MTGRAVLILFFATPCLLVSVVLFFLSLRVHLVKSNYQKNMEESEKNSKYDLLFAPLLRDRFYIYIYFGKARTT